MKVEVLMNGTTKIVLIPENEIEKAILSSVGKTNLAAVYVDKGTALLDKVVPEALVISPNKEEKNT